MYYSLKEISSILNGIIDRFQAKNIRFTAIKENSTVFIVMLIKTKFNDWLHISWTSVEECLKYKSSCLHKNVFCVCQQVYMDYEYCFKNNIGHYHDLKKNDVKFLEIMGSCNSLEELQVKTDLYIA